MLKKSLAGSKYALQNVQITQNYNKYKFAMIILFAAYGITYLRHNLMQPEFEVRTKPNILIPKNIYDVRRSHHIYWEISRIARGYNKTFSYYNYDKESVSAKKFYIKI
jgi:hypothetical protein